MRPIKINDWVEFSGGCGRVVDIYRKKYNVVYYTIQLDDRMVVISKRRLLKLR